MRKAAKRVSFEWPGVVEAEDLEQEIWMHLLKKPATQQKLAEMSQKPRLRALRRIGHQIASEYRASYEVFSANIFYPTREVRNILDSAAAPTGEEEVPGSLTHTEQMDLVAGFERLAQKNPPYARYLEGAYFTGERAHKYPMELTRAVDALTNHMNSVHRERDAEYESENLEGAA